MGELKTDFPDPALGGKLDLVNADPTLVAESKSNFAKLDVGKGPELNSPGDVKPAGGLPELPSPEVPGKAEAPTIPQQIRCWSR